MPSWSRVRDHAVIVLSTVLGGGSLLLFFAWPFELVPLGLSERATLLWDALLSAVFFLQHSVMVGAPVRAWFGRLVPERYLGALYSIASGVVLALVLLVWQRSPEVVLSVDGPARWLLRGLGIAGLAGFVWGVRSLRGFDPFGLQPVKAHLHGTTPRPSAFMVRGAYRWVRHPLYTSVLALFWAEPDVTADRLLFDVLWTAWVVLATRLEERDLEAEFGGAYRDYRRSVPMLLPWHAPRAPPEAAP